MGKNQEVAVQESTAVAEVSLGTDMSAWGDDTPMSARDIVIPKILAMQGLSDLVTEGKASFGEFRDSVNHELLGSINSPIEFVPFHMDKSWIISTRKVGTEKFEFEKYESVNGQDYPFTEVIGDTEYKYEYTLQFYVLLVKDPSMPYVLSLKGTSSKTGKILSTQMFIRNKMAGLNPAAIVIELGGKKEKNEKGTFVVMEVKPKGKTPNELMSAALDWLKIIKAGKATVAPEATTPDTAYAQENVNF